ncbi:hypothetical protein AVEN_246156-1 [Araneus ventricosus]|uniref:Uncharacterized protein n=1 Tax=Araneus ventricosus TaxID=182803 RepID=A0A4Y2N388_ARAVE|nr:hypothetical protein AVEN_246156-1 [Araneus ventricosus]
MEQNGPSRLQCAYINYLNSRDSCHHSISAKKEKYERCICILKMIIFCSSGIVGYILVVIYSELYASFFINMACFFVIWICFFLLLFRKYVPWRNMFDSFRRIFYCPWSCPIAPTEDRGIQTEEYTACQPAALHNATGEQFAVQHDASEELIAHQHPVLHHRIEERTSIFVFRKYLPSRKILSVGRIFCCPRSCYSTVSTEDLGIQAEEYAADQIAAPHDTTEEQTAHQSDRIQEQTAHEVDALQAMSEEVSTKLQIVEQRLLQYLLSSTEEQGSPFNE